MSSVGDTADTQGGRFDLVTPLGTLYVADDLETAVRERARDIVGARQVVSAAFAASFSVATIAVQHDVRCADIAARQAAHYGATRQLETIGDYSITRAWAAAFYEAGLQGVRYGSRFTSGPARARGVFGDDGPCTLTVTSEITGADACEQAGIDVLPPIRRASDVTLIAHPADIR